MVAWSAISTGVLAIATGAESSLDGPYGISIDKSGIYLSTTSLNPIMTVASVIYRGCR
jgi:hypothetical protein